MAGNPDFDTIASTTLANFRKVLQDNLIQRQALAFQIADFGLVTEDEGGTSINQPLLFQENDTVKSFAGYDLLDLTPQEGITQAQYPWKYLAGSVTISDQEKFENQGAGRIINLMEAKMTQLETSARLEFGRQLYGDGTGNAGKDITGLALAVEDGAAFSTYGGIDSSLTENAFWRNQHRAFTGTSFETPDGASTEGLRIMRQMFLDTLRGGSKTSLILTTHDLFESYEAVIEGDKLRTTDTRMGDAGFINLAFKGVPVVPDDDMDATDMLFLNARNLKFVFGRGGRFRTTDFRRAQNQAATFAFLFIFGNLVTIRRDTQGRITGLVAG